MRKTPPEFGPNRSFSVFLKHELLMLTFLQRLTTLGRGNISPILGFLQSSNRIFYKQFSDIANAKKFISERINNKESIIFVADALLLAAQKHGAETNSKWLMLQTAKRNNLAFFFFINIKKIAQHCKKNEITNCQVMNIHTRYCCFIIILSF